MPGGSAFSLAVLDRFAYSARRGSDEDKLKNDAGTLPLKVISVCLMSVPFCSTMSTFFSCHDSFCLLGKILQNPFDFKSILILEN